MHRLSLMVILIWPLAASSAEAGRKLTPKMRLEQRRNQETTKSRKDALMLAPPSHKLTARGRLLLRRGNLAPLQGNLGEAEQLIEQNHLTFTASEVRVNAATYRLSDLFKIDAAGRLGVLFYVQVDGVTYLRAAYRSQSQGTFRILPAINDKAVVGRPGFDKGIGENSLTLPFPVQQYLADHLKLRSDLTPAQGYGLLKAAVRYNASPLAWLQYHEALKTHFTTRDLLDVSHSPRDPHSLAIADDGDRPVFVAGEPSYHTQVATAGGVDAYAYHSQNKELTYTLFHIKAETTGSAPRSWIASIVSARSDINVLGVHAQALNVSTLAAPLWEYKQQIAPGFVGKAHAELPSYALNWKFVKRLALTAEWYQVHDAPMPATQSQIDDEDEDLPSTQVLDEEESDSV